MPLGSSSLGIFHIAQNISLIWLSLLFLPLSTYVLVLSYVFNATLRFLSWPGRRPKPGPYPHGKIILVTGIGMSKGLKIARLFHLSGHTVIGADIEPYACGRVSRAVSRFYNLAETAGRADGTTDVTPYFESLVSIITRENVDLWVSCSSVASAVEDGEAKEIIEARTSCRAIQFDAATTRLLHEKHSFIERVSELGLTIPETHTVTSRDQAGAIFDRATPGKKFLMKSIALDDASRSNMKLLPLETREKTEEHLSSLAISPSRPWIVQEYVSGSEFCTHSLVVKGEVAAFLACPSSDLLMHYEMLRPESGLSHAMLKFTRRFAEAGGRDFTGHLSFDFLVRPEDLEKHSGNRIILYPIECNPRAHTAVVLFDGNTELVGAYLTALGETAVTYGQNGLPRSPQNWPVIPKQRQSYYWVGHDLVTLLLLPILLYLLAEQSMWEVLLDWKTFAEHLLFWKDGTYELWDPLPFWWLYHIYWPVKFLQAIWDGKYWSRINVSTTKMFLV